MTLTLLGLLVFMQLSDPARIRLGRRLLSLRSRYSWLAIALLLIFLAMAATKIYLIIVGII